MMRPERIFFAKSDHEREAIQFCAENVVDLRLGPFMKSSKMQVVSVVQFDTFYHCLLSIGSLLTSFVVGLLGNFIVTTQI